jgi:flavin-dependent dehydrogenase
MTPEVIIVGAGLAGSAAAIQLSRAGRRVVILDKEKQPHHKVCGEFLSQEALHYLQTLGVEVAQLGAVPVHSVRIAGVTRPLPFAAMSLTRRCLDEELLRIAAEAGATVVRGARAQSLARTARGWQVNVEDGSGKESILHAPDVFLATGKHDLRGRSRPAGRQSDLVAFKMYFRLKPAQVAALDGCVELHLFRGGYAGLQPVEDGAANLCCLVQRNELRRIGGRWENLLTAMQADSPLLRQRLADAEPMLSKPLALSSIPYGYVREATEPSLWVLGDQAAVIPSFSGDGMSIALHSGHLAASMYQAKETSESFQHQQRLDLGSQVLLATILSKGLVWAPSRNIMAASVKLLPSLVDLFARGTRISQQAVRKNVAHGSAPVDAYKATPAMESTRHPSAAHRAGR